MAQHFEEKGTQPIPFVTNTIIVVLLFHALSELITGSHHLLSWVSILINITFALCLFLEMPGARKGLINISILLFYYELIHTSLRIRERTLIFLLNCFIRLYTYFPIDILKKFQ